MFVVIHGSDLENGNIQLEGAHRIGQATSLEDARDLRQVTGDLVFDTDTGEVNQSRKWLWSFEKEDPDCYARRAQARKAKLERVG